MIGIIDYGMGNLRSVTNALEFLGSDVKICDKPEQILSVERIVLPGVGAFEHCIQKLISQGWIEVLFKEVIQNKKPTLGICLGMQVMARISNEFGVHNGIGWFDAEVVKIKPSNDKIKLPNIGWNETFLSSKHPLFEGVQQKSDFYYVHSYHMVCKNDFEVIATYSLDDQIITAAVAKENIVATQFHPEKSQDNGLLLLENFIDWSY